MESLRGLEARVISCREQGKHLFIWDKTGLVPTYFEEFGVHKEFTNEMVSVALAKANINKVLDSSLESLGNALVQAL